MGAPAHPLLTRASYVACFLLVAVPAVSFVLSSPRFGGYDSYYFLLYAGDLAQSARDTSLARYSYFPGSYAFWRAVALAAGRNYAAYQSVFAGVGLVNAALTALIVRAAGGGALLAASSFCGYLVFGSRLELGLITTEPLATIPSLAGALLWLTLRRRGRPRVGLACLGAGYGLAVFSKQQGAFVAMGAVGLAPALWGRSRSWLQGVGDAATIVVTAIAVFALAMAADGGGVAAVKTGIATAVDYESRGQLAANLFDLARRSPALFAALGATIILWPAAFALSRRRPADDRTELLPIWALGAATAVVTLLQFSKRGYAHYALLTLPFALMAVAMAVAWSASRLSARFAPTALVLAMSLFGIEAWALPRAEPWPPPLHEAYASMCDGIQPGERLLLLPSRQNALHWACGTNARGTRWGYTFGYQERPDEYIAELAKPELSQVFVFKADADHPYEREVARRHDWSGFFAALQTQGFSPAAQQPAGTLFRRAARERAREEAEHGHE